MIQLTIYSLASIIGILFIQMNHPLAMGLTLLIQTTLICLISGMVAKSFWYSYVLLIIFLGGMLVLFIYVTSLASNEMFSLSTKLTLILFTIMLTSLIVIMMTDKMNYYTMTMNNEMDSLTNTNSLIKENILSLNKLYNYPTNLITILLINYLLITLIAIVKITNVFYGPLRTMNN